MRHLIKLLKKDQGATAIEYGLIASLIAVATIAVLTNVGTALSSVFSKVQASL